MMLFRAGVIALICVISASCSIQNTQVASVMVGLPSSTAVEDAPKVAEPALEKLAQGICGKPIELDPREFKVQVAQDVQPEPIMVSANFRCTR